MEPARIDPARSNFRYGEGPKVVRDHDANNPLTDPPSRNQDENLTEAPPTTDSENNQNVIMGSIWMVAITIGLFFLPALNGLIAGTVGGYMVGSTKRALMAAVIPAFIAAGGLWVLLATLDFPVVGFFVGAALGVHIILSEIGLFLGAAIGGTVAQTKIDRFNRA
jgi:hypothetical protein